MKSENPNRAKQSLSNLISTTERGCPCLYIMNQIRRRAALRRGYDPVTLNGFCWESRWLDTEDSDGLTKQKTLRNRESSGIKAHFTGTLPVYLLKDGLAQVQTERLDRNWQNKWQKGWRVRTLTKSSRTDVKTNSYPHTMRQTGSWKTSRTTGQFLCLDQITKLTDGPTQRQADRQATQTDVSWQTD